MVSLSVDELLFMGIKEVEEEQSGRQASKVVSCY